jgi:site-specific DNA-methyltransferase (adenine-specific)
LYLHCDPTASHYLKLLLDAIFGPRNFRAEIIWERSGAHNMRNQGWARTNDSLLSYAKTDASKFNIQFQAMASRSCVAIGRTRMVGYSKLRISPSRRCGDIDSSNGGA